MNATLSQKPSLFRAETKEILIKSALPSDNQDPWQCGYEFGVWHLTLDARRNLIDQMEMASRLEKEMPMFSSFEIYYRPEVEFVALQLTKLFRADWFDDEMGHHDLKAIDLSEYAKKESTARGYDCSWVTVSSDRVTLGFGVAGNTRRVWTEEISREFLEGLEFQAEAA